MPEWNIQRISKFPTQTNSFNSNGKYYVEAFDETWDLFKMHNKFAKIKVHRLLNFQGQTTRTFNEELSLHCLSVSYSLTIFDSNTNFSKAMIIPDEFVKNYGIRVGEYLDFTISSIGNPLDKTDEPVFPKSRINGIIAINPSSDRAIPTSRTTDILIEQSLKEEFFVKLIQDINDTYAYELYRATHILLRTLFENLIFKLLKKKFPNEPILYMGKRGSLDFSRLIDNFEAKKSEFVPFAKSFDVDFFSFLDEFREKANTSTHILEIYLDKDKIDKDKTKMNQYIKILDYVINEISLGNN